MVISQLSPAEINVMMLIIGFLAGAFAVGTVGWFKNKNCDCKKEG